MRLLATTLSLLFSLSLAAQTIDTLGGTTTPVTGGPTSKASVFRCDQSVLLTDYAMWLDVPGPTTLTFFVFRHHSRSGAFTQMQTYTVPVQGGTGPGWYSTGPIVLPLLCGNHYLIGASWPGQLTYYYNRAAAAFPISFGTWERANTLASPPPATFNVASGIDVACYHQQLTTLPIPAVNCIGTGCNPAGTLPRLVANRALTLGNTTALEVVGGTPSAIALYALTFGLTLPQPVPFFGCPVWLNLGGQVSSDAVVLSSAGFGALNLPVPQNPLYLGTQLSVQAGVLGAQVSTTGALELVVN